MHAWIEQHINPYVAVRIISLEEKLSYFLATWLL